MPTPIQPLSKEEKIQQLLVKRQDTLDKLKELYKHFHGVKHENSASEIRYTRIKVLEGFIQSIDLELQSLGHIMKRGQNV
jgi:hypothetical protein